MVVVMLLLPMPMLLLFSGVIATFLGHDWCHW